MMSEIKQKFTFSLKSKKIKRHHAFQKGIDLENQKLSHKKSNIVETSNRIPKQNKPTKKEKPIKHLYITDYEIQNDPRSLFKKFYNEALTYGEKSNFPEALKSFDLSIRFWGVHLSNLKAKHNIHFDVVDNTLIDNLLENFDRKKKTSNSYLNNPKKKKLWKPPPTNQPKKKETKKEVGENEEEVIVMEDDDIETDEEDIDILNIVQNDEKKELETILGKEIVEHKIEGSKVFEGMGQILMELDRDFEAINVLKQSICLNVDWIMPWLSLSRAELNWGDPFKSLKTITYIIENGNDAYENKDILEHYGYVQSICNNLKNMKENGSITEHRLYSRLIVKKNDLHPLHLSDIKNVKKRIKNRNMNKDDVGRLNNGESSVKIVNNVEQVMKMTQDLKIEK